jgi:hypothetical protein
MVFAAIDLCLVRHFGGRAVPDRPRRNYGTALPRGGQRPRSSSFATFAINPEACTPTTVTTSTSQTSSDGILSRQDCAIPLNLSVGSPTWPLSSTLRRGSSVGGVSFDPASDEWAYRQLNREAQVMGRRGEIVRAARSVRISGSRLLQEVDSQVQLTNRYPNRASAPAAFPLWLPCRAMSIRTIGPEQ